MVLTCCCICVIWVWFLISVFSLNFILHWEQLYWPVCFNMCPANFVASVDFQLHSVHFVLHSSSCSSMTTMASLSLLLFIFSLAVFWFFPGYYLVFSLAALFFLWVWLPVVVVVVAVVVLFSTSLVLGPYFSLLCYRVSFPPPSACCLLLPGVSALPPSPVSIVGAN